MAVIERNLGGWRPDLPALNNPGVLTAQNVVPAVGGYQPFSGPALYANTTLSGGRPLGAISAQDRTGAAHVMCANATGLHKIDPETRSWKNVSRPAGYTTAEGDNWRFTERGSLIIAANVNNPLQGLDLDAADKFSDLTTLVSAKYVVTCKGFVLAANTYDQFDGRVPNRVRWSAFENPYDWNFSLATQSDFQDLMGTGAIQGMMGGEYVTILTQRGVWKFTYTNPPYVWQVDNIIPGKGCKVAESVTVVEGAMFFLGDDGFQMLIGDQLQPIGGGKVDRYFLNNADPNGFHRMTACGDPERKLIYWTYVSQSAVHGVPDKIIIYNYQTGEWSEVDSGNVSSVFRSMSLPTTLNQLDAYGSLEAVPASLDSALWTGGASMLWSLDDDGRIYTFTGANLVGVLETGDMHVAKLLAAAYEGMQGDRSILQGVRPLVDGSSVVQARIASRALLGTDPPFSFAANRNDSTGFCYVRGEGRYHRVRLVLNGNWTQAMGLEIDAVMAGFR